MEKIKYIKQDLKRNYYPRFHYSKTFFEKRGYKVIKEQHVERQGIVLENFLMEKK